MSDTLMNNEVKNYAIIPETQGKPAEVVRVYSSAELMELHEKNSLPDLFHYIDMQGQLVLGYNPETHIAYDLDQEQVVEDTPPFQSEVIETAQIVESQDKPFPVRKVLFTAAGTALTLAACNEPMTGTFPTKDPGAEVTSVANVTETITPPTSEPTPTSTPVFIVDGIEGGSITNYEGGEFGPTAQRIEALGKRVDAVISTLAQAEKITADAVQNVCWTQTNANHEVNDGVCAGVLLKPFGGGESISPAGSWIIPALTEPTNPSLFTIVDLPEGAAFMVWESGQIVAKDGNNHIIATRNWDGEARMGESWIFGSELGDSKIINLLDGNPTDEPYRHEGAQVHQDLVEILVHMVMHDYEVVVGDDIAKFLPESPVRDRLGKIIVVDGLFYTPQGSGLGPDVAQHKPGAMPFLLYAEYADGSVAFAPQMQSLGDQDRPLTPEDLEALIGTKSDQINGEGFAEFHYLNGPTKNPKNLNPDAFAAENGIDPEFLKYILSVLPDITDTQDALGGWQNKPVPTKHHVYLATKFYPEN